jgi:hypothetical protein
MSRQDARDALAGLISAEGLERSLLEEGELEAVQLITVDDEGWPHSALLSAGEILGVDDDHVALCLWRGSTTTRNVTRDGRALLSAITRGAVVKVRLAVRPLGPLTVGDREFQAFVAAFDDIAGDAVGYAEVVSGIRFRLTDADQVVSRWRAQRQALAELVRASR